MLLPPKIQVEMWPYVFKQFVFDNLTSYSPKKTLNMPKNSPFANI
jgi:hypothetical protein